jgi:hypothetical protein
MPAKRKTRTGATAQPMGPDDASRLPNWMTTVPEILTIKQVQARRDWMEAIYSDEIVRKIASAGRFSDPIDIPALKEFLVVVGLWFDDHKDSRNPSASHAAEREQLKRIAKQAEKLETALVGATSVTAEVLWRPFSHMMLWLHPDAPSHIIPELGLTVTRRQHTDGAFEMQHLLPHQMIEAVSVIRKTAELAASKLPTQKGGNREFEALLNWINSAFHFWTKNSLLAFDPRSPAFDFCYIAFKRLVQDITESQIRTAMRTINGRHRRLRAQMERSVQKSK